jgi:hypothetical protein
MLKHRPFKVDGDIPITRSPMLLSKLKKAFELLNIYQPFGSISALGIKESIKILNYYSDDLKKIIIEKQNQNIFETKSIDVSEEKLCLGDLIWHVGNISNGVVPVPHLKMQEQKKQNVQPKISSEILKKISTSF